MLSVFYTAGARELAQDWFGPAVADELLARAVGALDGAEVVFSLRRGWLFADIAHPHLREQKRSIRRDRAGALFIYNHEFTKRHDAPPYLGVRALLTQIKAAQPLGIQRIHLYGEGDAKSVSRNGYYTWARCGFDAPLWLEEQKNLSGELYGARTLNELMQHQSGIEWWRRNGCSRSMVFDLALDSSMMEVLRNYLQELEAKGWKW